MTCFPYPRMIIHPEDTALKLLRTVDEKTRLLEKSGIDHLLLIPFTRDFSNLTSTEFIKKILIDTIGVKKLVIGYDHRFGKNREGTFEDLCSAGRQHGFGVRSEEHTSELQSLMRN